MTANDGTGHRCANREGDGSTGQFSRVVFDRWAIVNRCGLPAPLKATLIGLLFYTRAGESCFPATATLATDLGIQERQLRNRLADLERQSVLRRERSGSLTYWVDWGRLETLNRRQPVTDRQSVTAHTRQSTAAPNGSQLPPDRQSTAAQTGNSLPHKRTGKTTTERANEENRAVKTLVPLSSTTISASLDTPDFAEAWAEWINYRRSKRKPVSAVAANRQLAELAEFGPKVAVEAIQVSIRNDWQGLFPAKVPRNGQGAPTISRGLSAFLGEDVA